MNKARHKMKSEGFWWKFGKFGLWLDNRLFERAEVVSKEAETAKSARLAKAAKQAEPKKPTGIQHTETKEPKIVRLASSIDPTRYSDTKRVVGLLFAMLTGPGGAEVDKMQKGPCPYCGVGTGVVRTPGMAQNLFHCHHCKKPIIYDHGASRFYAVKGY